MTFLLSLPIVPYCSFDICWVLMWCPQRQTSGRVWHVCGRIVPGCMSPQQVTMQWWKCCPLYLDFRKCWLVFYNRVCAVRQRKLSISSVCASPITVPFLHWGPVLLYTLPPSVTHCHLCCPFQLNISCCDLGWELKMRQVGLTVCWHIPSDWAPGRKCALNQSVWKNL